jgi:glutamate-1-semialdehyde 2,1-aminomutase
MLSTSTSEALFEEAVRLIPGGVNSPVRAYRAVGGKPPFIARGEGAWVWDVEGRRYLDMMCSWGPLILGHRPTPVLQALQDQLNHGWTFGAPTEGEVRLAGMVSARMPSIEMLRLVNSGTEATMSAVRLARAATGRRKLLKFAGGYHGHADSLLVDAGSGVATLGIPGTPGITSGAVEDTLVARFNRLDDVEAALDRYPEQIAAVIVEPVAGNMGVVPPEPLFLEGLRRLTHQSGCLLIFDEVITGFRLAPGGAQELYGVIPDLTCLGKILGGGLPIGAYGGRRDLMERVAPAGPVYQAGTLSGNPLAVAAGIATLSELSPARYSQLDEAGKRVADAIMAAATSAGVPITVNRVGSMLTAFFIDRPVRDYETAKLADTHLFARWFRRLLRRGVSLPPSQLESTFLSTAHDTEALTYLERQVVESLTDLAAA